MTRNDGSPAAILLVSGITQDRVAQVKDSQFWSLIEHIESADNQIGRNKRVLIDFGLGAHMVARGVALLARATAKTFEMGLSNQSGATTLTPFDQYYTTRLHATLRLKALLILHVPGPPKLLDQPGVRAAALTAAAQPAKVLPNIPSDQEQDSPPEKPRGV